MVAGRELSGKPVIWEPLVHAPLQTAAATTNVAIALTHQQRLAAHIFLPPSSISSPLSPDSTLVPRHPRHSHPSLGSSHPSSISSPASGAPSHLHTPAAGSPCSPMFHCPSSLDSVGPRGGPPGQSIPRPVQKGEPVSVTAQAQLSKSRGTSVSTSLLQQPSSTTSLPPGRTLHYSLSRATGSHISLLLQPQQLVRHRSTQGLSAGCLTQDVRPLSASQPSLPQRLTQQADMGPSQQSQKSAGNLTHRSSPSVSGLLAKPAPNNAGQAASLQQVPLGSSRSTSVTSTPQSPASTPRHMAPPSRKGSVVFSPDVDTAKPKFTSNM